MGQVQKGIPSLDTISFEFDFLYIGAGVDFSDFYLHIKDAVYKF